MLSEAIPKKFKKIAKKFKFYLEIKKIILIFVLQKIRKIQFKIAIKIVKPEKLKFKKETGASPFIY